jgi:hypothetical protein
MINSELSSRSTEPILPQKDVALPRQLIIDVDELNVGDHSVSLTAKIINGCFGETDVQYFSKQFPEYDGRKIDWVPTDQPIRTLRSSHNTTKIYKVFGRLSPKPTE